MGLFDQLVRVFCLRHVLFDRYLLKLCPSLVEWKQCRLGYVCWLVIDCFLHELKELLTFFSCKRPLAFTVHGLEQTPCDRVKLSIR